MKPQSMIQVLVIEDDRETADYIQKGLTECGHVVDQAGDGKDGLLLADSHSHQRSMDGSEKDTGS